MSATTLSCPECQTTLKSGMPIPEGKPIKCPKCGAVFPAPAPIAQEIHDTNDEKKARIVQKKNSPFIPAGEFNDEGPTEYDQEEDDYDDEPVRRRKKRRTNTTKILAVAIGSALIVLLFVGVTAYFIWNNVVNKGRNRGTGKEDPLAFVPADSTRVFGVDLGPLWEQPALAAQIENAIHQDPQDLLADIKKNTGIEEREFLDHVIFAMKTNAANPAEPPQMSLILHTKEAFSQNKIRDSAKDLTPQKAGGKTYYKRNVAPGSGQWLWLYMPSDRILVLSDLPEAQMKELVEADGIEPKLPAPVISMAQGFEKSHFWMVEPFSAASKQQMEKGLAMIRWIIPPDLTPVTNALPQAKMLALCSSLANNKVSLQVSLVCADDGTAKQVETSLQNFWDKNSKGQAGLQTLLRLEKLPKDQQPTVKEMLENLQFSSQGASVHVSTLFTAPSIEILERLITRLRGPFFPGGIPGGMVPGGPPPGFRPGGGFKRQG